MIELKNCPFCGKSVAEMTNAQELENCANFEGDECPCRSYEDIASCNLHIVVCSVNRGGCGAASGYYTTAREAAEKWNRRTLL